MYKVCRLVLQAWHYCEKSKKHLHSSEYKAGKSVNNKFRELAEQAAKYADYYAMLSDLAEKEIFTERFGKLIVLECAKLVEDNIDPENAWITPAHIKEHFGVE